MMAQRIRSLRQCIVVPPQQPERQGRARTEGSELAGRSVGRSLVAEVLPEPVEDQLGAHDAVPG
jgi:hypothetical protein